MLIIIAAVSKNNVIGNAGRVPWHIKGELERFRKLTMGFPVIVGRKTYEGLPTKPLPGRTNVVVTRQAGLRCSGAVVKNSLIDAIEYCRGAEKVFIIGGQSVYEQAMKFADRLELTMIDGEYSGDAFFPPINPNEWVLTAAEEHAGFAFTTHERRHYPPPLVNLA
jgi:dihydrofolate reductase